MNDNGFRGFAELKSNPPALGREQVEIPEWETTIVVRQLSGREQQKIIDLGKGRKADEFSVEDMAKILALSIEDSRGDKPEVEWLMGQAFSVLNQLTKRVFSFNGLTEESGEALRKN